MKLRTLIVITAACGHPAAPVHTPPVAIADTQPPPSCFLQGPSLAPDEPITGYLDGTVHTGAYWYCELPDRVVIVDHTRDPQQRFTGDVVEIPRAGTLARSNIDVTSSCSDPCGNDGWAGCSMQASCHVTSGARDIVTGYETSSPFAIQVIDNAWCGPMADTGVIAACTTATRSIVVRQDTCATDPHELTLVGMVYDGDAPRIADGDDGEVAAPPSHTLAGGAPVEVDNGWTYDFGPDASLRFQLGPSPRATFMDGDATEDCVAFAITPY